jgi:hypothetical protein
MKIRSTRSTYNFSLRFLPLSLFLLALPINSKANASGRPPCDAKMKRLFEDASSGLRHVGDQKETYCSEGPGYDERRCNIAQNHFSQFETQVRSIIRSARESGCSLFD